MFTVDQVRDALGAELLGESAGAAASFSAVTNDSRVARPGELFVALRTPDPRATTVVDGHDFIADAVAKGVAGVVVDRAEIDLPEGVWAFLVRDTKHAIGELAHAYRARFHVKAIVVTGNVGKTTTKELIAAVLETKFNVLKSPANFNDEIGLAMTLFQLTEAHQRAVLEVGMFEPGEIRRLCAIARPETAVVLNVGPTHLERLGSIEAIAEAKAEALEALSQYDTAILNADDPYVAAMEHKTKARVITFGVKSHALVHATDVKGRGLAGVDFMLSCGGRALHAHSPLPGADLVPNAL
ncbi:MAG TPA: UDP-N-acetylmuramoyl-tripeptide--D-alanyl-D-alanine ligase, partial [Dehalococcoidia bacterium]|nr:UDP-N-acetylmuramoyl-tripeptide--D-alanyl-D-alanine ligase [Dehalococcoidia bacterium]